jgi:Skp family chaperone for outer membrane proteins
MTILPRLPLFALALALLPATVHAQTPAAAAQAPAKQMVAGIGIANRDEIVANSKAFKNANSERQIVYKNQIAMAEARRKQINGQIEPLVKKFRDDQQLGSATEGELQSQAQTIQNLQQSGVQELNTMLAPVALSEAYVNEQIGEVLSKAIVAAMDKRGITLVVPPQNFLAFNNGYNMSADVLAELDTLLPNAGVIPPDGWRPRAEREAAAAQAAQLAKPAPTRR